MWRRGENEILRGAGALGDGRGGGAGVPETAGKSSQFGAAPRTSSAARLNYKSVLLHLASRNVFAGGFGLHS